MWLNYFTFNGVAPIKDLHLVSDAGAGEGLMKYHPTRDTELIACGQANTPLKGRFLPSPCLTNGSVTPAILVHGILTALQKKGFKIRLHCYQLGLDHLPDFTNSKLDDVVVHQCECGEEQQLINSVMVPELKREAAMNEQHLIAESGIGGTTYATVWLKHWLSKEMLLAGSTKDPIKLTRKEQLIRQLLSKTCDFARDVSLFLNDKALSDPIQRATCALLANRLPEINLAGGTMFFAPVIAMQTSRVERINIATTRWIMDSTDATFSARYLPKNSQLVTPIVDFNHSRYDAIRMYERGYVVEGCGLGATLRYAEQQGLSSQQIIASLDNAVAHWIE